MMNGFQLYSVFKVTENTIDIPVNLKEIQSNSMLACKIGANKFQVLTKFEFYSFFSNK